MRESRLEAACWVHALARGVPSKKIQGGIVGDPDRVFLLPGRRCWWVEFKTPTGRLSPRQRVVHADHETIGHPVSVVRSLDDFKELLKLQLWLAQKAVDAR